jgi:hypothetical protein
MAEPRLHLGANRRLERSPLVGAGLSQQPAHPLIADRALQLQQLLG